MTKRKTVRFGTTRLVESRAVPKYFQLSGCGKTLIAPGLLARIKKSGGPDPSFKVHKDPPSQNPARKKKAAKKRAVRGTTKPRKKASK